MAEQNKNPTGKTKRGFASMDPEQQRRIAAEGGRAAHLKGTAHEFTSEEASAAGRKGGQRRGAELREQMIRSQQEGEEFRSENQGSDQRKAGA